MSEYITRIIFLPFSLIIFQNVIKGVQCFTHCSMLYTYILNKKAGSKGLSF